MLAYLLGLSQFSLYLITSLRLAGRTNFCLANMRIQTMAKCNVCGKGPQFGHNRSHALNATRKISQPNVFKKSLMIDGERKRMNVCTRCIRTLEKRGKLNIAAK